jgi:CubicO group peptidase (beta-lactamase class C family)
LSRRLDYNRADVLRAQIPGANLVATARSLAKLYASAVGDVDGIHTVSAAPLARATVEQSSGAPLFGFGLPGDSRWGFGFQLPSPVSRPMLGEASFGHDGAGGGFAFGDSARNVAFGYIDNQMEAPADDRANGLVRALASCLG